jgi:hypothetical protein
MYVSILYMQIYIYVHMDFTSPYSFRLFEALPCFSNFLFECFLASPVEPGLSFRLCCAADALRQSHAPAPPAQYDFRAVVAMLGCSDATRMVGKRVEGAGVMFPANLNC